MADDSKVTIELDLENKSFIAKAGQTKSMFEGLEQSASSAFNSTLLGVVSVNQALEVAEKVLRGFEAALKTIEYTESFKNQQTALSNLTTQIGVDSNALVEIIKRSTGGTITSLEATQTAFKLLSAGVKAENIPAFVQFAEVIEKSSGGMKSFNSVIDSVSFAVSTGMTRSLREFDLVVKNNGTRLDLQNAILEQAKNKTEQLGTGYLELSKVIETRFSESMSQAKKKMGDFFTGVGFQIFATDTEKAAKNIETLEKQLAKIPEQIANGKKQWDLFDPVSNTVKWVSAAEKQAALEAEIAKLKGTVAQATSKEVEENKKLEASIVQQTDLKKPLLQFEKDRADLMAKNIAVQRQASEEEAANGEVSLKTLKQIVDSKKSMIEKEFSDRKSNIMDTERNEAVLRDKLVELEIDKINKIKALRVEDEDFKRAQRDAQLKIVEEDSLFQEDSMKRHKEIKIQMVNDAYAFEMEKLRSSGLEKDEFNRQMEEKEREHQQKLSDIKRSYEGVNLNNLKFGMNQSLTQMRQQFGSFSNFVNSATTKTHGIMVKGFVDMAKGHGDAMEQMLKQFLTMIGTQMIESGTFHLLAGAASMNPQEAGMGAALIGAGMALVGAGASGGGGETATGGGGMGYEPTTSAPATATEEQRESKKAAIIINGDFLNSRETANHLAEVLRENSDVTDYTITAQGRSYI